MTRHHKHALAAAAAVTCALSAHADEIVRIGQVAPLTGAIAHLGKDSENGRGRRCCSTSSGCDSLAWNCHRLRRERKRRRRLR